MSRLLNTLKALHRGLDSQSLPAVSQSPELKQPSNSESDALKTYLLTRLNDLGKKDKVLTASIKAIALPMVSQVATRQIEEAIQELYKEILSMANQGLITLPHQEIPLTIDADVTMSEEVM